MHLVEYGKIMTSNLQKNVASPGRRSINSSTARILCAAGVIFFCILIILNEMLLGQIAQTQDISAWLITAVRALMLISGGLVLIIAYYFLNLATTIPAPPRALDKVLEFDSRPVEYSAILDSVKEGVIYTEGLTMRYMNHTLAHLTGYNAQDWQGYLELLRPDSVSPVEFGDMLREIRRAVTEQGTWQGEVQLKRKDGALFEASLTCLRVPRHVQDSSNMVTIIADISREKTLHAQKLRFVASASHELRTPITNLKTRLYLLHKQPARFSEHLYVIEQVVDRLHKLVERLLDLSRFERGIISVRRERVNLQELIDTAVQLQTAQAEMKDISLVQETPDKPLLAFVDPQRMMQVLTNLIVNAVNYTLPGGQIVVRLYKAPPNPGEDSPGSAIIEVQDNGMGIAPESLDQIFNPFFRATHEGDGSGIGLSIVKEIVNLHGGEVTVESEVNQGTLFRVTLQLIRSNEDKAA